MCLPVNTGNQVDLALKLQFSPDIKVFSLMIILVKSLLNIDHNSLHICLLDIYHDSIRENQHNDQGTKLFYTWNHRKKKY